MRRARGLALAVALLTVTVLSVATACCDPTGGPPGDPVGCTRTFLGTATRPIDFEFLVANPDYQIAVLHDGDTVPMLIPPQGGQVVFVGVRATNLGSCGVVLTGALRDETSRQVRFDQRTINLIPTGDGWGSTGPIGMSLGGVAANFSNIPVCPNQWSTADVFDHSYALEVTVKDSQGRSLEKTIHVTPKCQPEDLTDCLCTCAKGYVLGSACAAPTRGDVDGGPDGA